jgi:flagellar hook-basal body complex protein FliE
MIGPVSSVSPGAASLFGGGAQRATGAAGASDVDKTKAAEATALDGVKGKASVEQVVSAIMDAERSLQTAMAVRDKLAQAYLELSRMGI